MAKRAGCPIGSHRVKNICRSNKQMCYHGRCGHFVIHQTQEGKRYVMVRKSGGGTKRLYLDKNGDIPAKHMHKKSWKSDPSKYVVNEFGDKEMTIDERMRRLNLKK